MFIPIDWVIGGEKMVGQGWRMLMECLAAGRAISLPSSATAGAKAMLRFTSAYARIRKQFGLPVARMEGVEEPLARIIEAAYANEAARAVTAAMVARGERPSVISALMKYQTTERMRRSVNDAFDIHGGRAICDGPSNYLQSAYQMMPVGITVEGRQHPDAHADHLRAGRAALAPLSLPRDPGGAGPRLRARRSMRSTRRSPTTWPSRCRMRRGPSSTTSPAAISRPRPSRPTRWRNGIASSARASRNFAFVADLTVAVLGGALKTKQKISGRLADALSELYFLACVLKRYEDDGRLSSDREHRGARRRQRALSLPGGHARRHRQFPHPSGALG